MKKTFILLLLGVISMLNLNAQEPQEIIELFFKNYQEKDSEAAVQIASATNPWLQKDTTIINMWKQRLFMVSNNNGEYCGYEILETNKTGNSLIEYECIVKHAKAPFKISIILYKPKDKWQVNSILISQNKQTKDKKRR